MLRTDPLKLSSLIDHINSAKFTFKHMIQLPWECLAEVLKTKVIVQSHLLEHFISCSIENIDHSQRPQLCTARKESINGIAHRICRRNKQLQIVTCDDDLYLNEAWQNRRVEYKKTKYMCVNQSIVDVNLQNENIEICYEWVRQWKE